MGRWWSRERRLSLSWPSASPPAARQAQEIVTLGAFLRAYDAGDLRSARGSFDNQLTWSDCDYARGIAVSGDGLESLTTWLQQRFADHDQLYLGQIDFGGPDGLVLGVSFARRTSDTLTAQGLPGGIEPQLAAKVIFDYSDPVSTGRRGLITGFANGPFGGPPDACQLSTYRR